MSGAGPELVILPGDDADLRDADLSSWFNAFLDHFAREANRCGGEATVLGDGSNVVALYVTDPVEKVGSVFSRSRELAERWVRDRGRFGVFAEFSLDPGAEPFDILSLGLEDWESPTRFRTPVRPLVRSDLAWVVPLMREVYGRVNERWFDGLPTPDEAGFVAEVDGRPVGVGWVSRVGAHARLHSLTVRAPYRRLGIGTDLLAARLLWARRMGCQRILSEIARDNLPSQLIALRAGMRRVGEIYFYRPR